MPDSGARRPRVILSRLARLATAVLSLAGLAIATRTWIDLSRPFDPPQLRAYTVAAPADLRVPPTVPGVVTVLTYHAVSDHNHAATTLTQAAFAAHLAALVAAGYHTIRLADIESLLAGRPVRLPERPLLLTFDDGSLTDWSTVDPVLRAYGLNAVAFLTTRRIVEPGTPSFYLSTRHLEALRDTGRWEFGSHTADLHDAVPVEGNIRPALTNRVLRGGIPETIEQWRTRVAADLRESQRFFRKVLGRPVSAFAYPFGDTGATANDPLINEELPALIQQAGFTLAFAGEQVPIGHLDLLDADTPRWRLPRIGVRATTTVDGLMWSIARATPVPPPRDLTTLSWTAQRTVGQRAACQRVPAGVAVTGSGNAACHNVEANTSRWRDYTITTTITGISRHCTAIVAVRDGIGAGHHGRVEVAVGESTAAMRQQIGALPRTTLVSAPIKAPAGKQAAAARALRVDVRGNRITMRVAGGQTVTADIDARLRNGGISFAVESEAACSAVFTAPTLDAA